VVLNVHGNFKYCEGMQCTLFRTTCNQTCVLLAGAYYTNITGGENDSEGVQESLPNQCTLVTEDEISPTGTLLHPSQFYKEMHRNHPSHVHSSHDDRAAKSLSSTAKKRH